MVGHGCQALLLAKLVVVRSCVGYYYGGMLLLNKTNLLLFRTMSAHSTWCVSTIAGLNRKPKRPPHVELVERVEIFSSRWRTHATIMVPVSYTESERIFL